LHARRSLGTFSVSVASPSYQDFLAEHIQDARALEHDPRPGADRIDRWYLCRP